MLAAIFWCTFDFFDTHIVCLRPYQQSTYCQYRLYTKNIVKYLLTVAKQMSMKGNMKKFFKWGAIVVVVLIVIGAIAGSGDSNPSTSNNNGASTKQEQQDQAYQANEDVTVGEVRWKLLEAKDRGTILKASESRYASIAKNKEASANSKFIQVHVEVENLGKEMKSATNLKLIDNQDREFTAASDTSEWVPEDKEMFLLSNLNPNVTHDFVAIYEVPQDAEGLALQVGDLNLFGGKEARINLGL